MPAHSRSSLVSHAPDRLPAAAHSVPRRAASWGCGVCNFRRVACITASALPCTSQATHAGRCTAGLDKGVVAAPARLGKAVFWLLAGLLHEACNCRTQLALFCCCARLPACSNHTARLSRQGFVLGPGHRSCLLSRGFRGSGVLYFSVCAARPWSTGLVRLVPSATRSSTRVL